MISAQLLSKNDCGINTKLRIIDTSWRRLYSNQENELEHLRRKLYSFVIFLFMACLLVLVS